MKEKGQNKQTGERNPGENEGLHSTEDRNKRQLGEGFPEKKRNWSITKYIFKHGQEEF